MRDGPVFREGAYNKIYTLEILVSPVDLKCFYTRSKNWSSMIKELFLIIVIQP